MGNVIPFEYDEQIGRQVYMGVKRRDFDEIR
jgi:hypothetical protein